MESSTRARQWIGWSLVGVGVLALPISLYLNIRSCNSSVAADNAPLDAGSVTVSSFSILGCITEYGMLDGSIERVFPPIGLTVLTLAAIIAGVLIAVTARRSTT